MEYNMLPSLNIKASNAVRLSIRSLYVSSPKSSTASIIPVSVNDASPCMPSISFTTSRSTVRAPLTSSLSVCTLPSPVTSVPLPAISESNVSPNSAPDIILSRYSVTSGASFLKNVAKLLSAENTLLSDAGVVSFVRMT